MIKKNSSYTVAPPKLISTSVKTDLETFGRIEQFYETIASHTRRRRPGKAEVAGWLLEDGRRFVLTEKIDVLYDAEDFDHQMMVKIPSDVWAEIKADATRNGTTAQDLANAYMHVALARVTLADYKAKALAVKEGRK